MGSLVKAGFTCKVRNDQNVKKVFKACWIAIMQSSATLVSYLNHVSKTTQHSFEMPHVRYVINA